MDDQNAVLDWFDSTVNRQLLPAFASTSLCYRYETSSRRGVVGEDDIAEPYLFLSADAIVGDGNDGVPIRERAERRAPLSWDHIRVEGGFSDSPNPCVFPSNLVVCCYATMDAARVGFDPSIKWKDGECMMRCLRLWIVRLRCLLRRLTNWAWIDWCVSFAQPARVFAFSLPEDSL